MDIDWLKRSDKKRKSGYFKGKEDEKDCAKRLDFKPTKASGASGIRKGDNFDGYHAVECKTTDKASFSIKLSELRKILSYACEAGVVPVFRITFKQKEVRHRFIVLDECDFASLLTEIRELRGGKE